MNRANILLVDDHPENLLALEAVLSRPDYHLVKASSGPEALMHLLKTEFAVMLLDVMMPGMDGYEVARLAKQRTVTAHIPTIFLSAVAKDLSHIFEGYSVGAVDYLTKPLEPEVVRAKVAVFVDLFYKTQEIKKQSELLREVERRKQELERQEWQRFIAESTASLSCSLDARTILKNIAQITVPKIATWAFVSLEVPEGAIPKQEWQHADSKKTEALRSVILPKAASLRDLRQFGILDINEASIDAQCLTQETAELFRDLQVASMIFVPLAAHGRTLGKLILGLEERRYSEWDLSLVEELAQRAGLALENSRLYSESKRAVATRDEFLSIASHELKTPITSLKLQLQMTRKRVASGKGLQAQLEKLSQSLDTSIKQVNRLATLVEDLLDVSRIQAGKLTFHYEKVNLAEVIQEVCEKLREQFDLARCELQVQVPSDIVGRWDRSRIEQVAVNLLSNAIKYAPGCAIHVIGRQSTPESVTLIVKDFGPGIEESQQSKIFERFERAVSAQKVSGLGLGLFIVKQIIDAHQGTIQVKSQLGKGSEFIVELPVEREERKERSLEVSCLQVE